MKRSVGTKLVLLGLLCGLAVLAGGCSLFGLKRKVQIRGSVTVRTWSGEVGGLIVKNISLKKETVTGEGPEILIRSDGGTKRVEISAPSDLIERLQITSNGWNLTVNGQSGAVYVTSESVQITVWNQPLSEITLSGACHCVSEVPLVGSRKENNIIVRLSGASQLLLPDVQTDETIQAELSGASSLTIDKVRAKSLKIDCSGASRVSMKDTVLSGEASWDISGASNLEMEGEGGKLSADVSGASTVRADGFALNSAHVSVSGASRMECRVKDLLSGSISGASTVVCSGDPEMTASVSGASRVEKR